MSSTWSAVYCLVLPIEPVCGNFVASRLLVAQWTVARVCEWVLSIGVSIMNAYICSYFGGYRETYILHAISFLSYA
jgi:hypothetical protein